MTAPKPRPKRRRARSSADILRAAILRLPTNLRDVFLLHRFGGLTYGEIGLRLGITPEAVQAALAAALVRLARTIRISERGDALKLTRLRQGIKAVARSAPGCGGL